MQVNWENLNKISGLHQCQSPSCDPIVLQDNITEGNWVKGTWDLAVSLTTSCESLIISKSFFKGKN